MDFKENPTKSEQRSERENKNEEGKNLLRFSSLFVRLSKFLRTNAVLSEY
jgi:hypothetical protein